MSYLREGDIVIDVTRAKNAWHFDSGEHQKICDKLHLSRIDIVIELTSHIVFLEVKDPEQPRAVEHGQDAEFHQRLTNGQIIKESCSKFRDTLYFQRASSALSKPIICVLLLVSERLGRPEVEKMTKSLSKQLPAANRKPDMWDAPPFDKCFVLDQYSWESEFEGFSVYRASAS